MDALSKIDVPEFNPDPAIKKFLDSQDECYGEDSFRKSFYDFLESRHLAGASVNMVMVKKIMSKVQVLFQDVVDDATVSLDNSARAGWPDIYKKNQKVSRGVQHRSKARNLNENFKFKRNQ